jgi:hypothetical protein
LAAANKPPNDNKHQHQLYYQQEFRYLASISVKDGKVFALFVRCPARAFGRSEADLRHVIDTFRLL